MEVAHAEACSVAGSDLVALHRSGLLQIQGHGDAVRVRLIISKGRTLHEAVALIEGARGLKIIPGAGLQA